jgi:tetratricopeptide (TPR) repeat protein
MPCWLKRNFQKAQKVFETLVGKHPENAMVYYRLGLAHDGQDQHIPAIRNYQKALSLKPEALDVLPA